MKTTHLVELWSEYADRLQAAEIEQHFGRKGFEVRYVKFSPWYIDLLYNVDGSRWT